jgi:hypothetical protein
VPLSDRTRDCRTQRVQVQGQSGYIFRPRGDHRATTRSGDVAKEWRDKYRTESVGRPSFSRTRRNSLSQLCSMRPGTSSLSRTLSVTPGRRSPRPTCTLRPGASPT